MAVFIAERMNRVSVAALKDDLDGVLRDAARLRVLHPAHVEETHAWAAQLDSMGAERTTSEYLQREHRLRQLCAGLAADVLIPGELPAAPLALDEIDRGIGRVESQVAPLLAGRNRLIEEQNKRSSLLNQLAVLLPPGVPLSGLIHSSFLHTAVGTVQASRLPALAMALSGVPSVVLPYRDEGERQRVLCIVLRRDTGTLDTALRDARFEAAPSAPDLGQVTAESVARLERELAETADKMAAVQGEIDGARTAVMPDLSALSTGIRAALVLLRMETFCRSTDHTCLFSGWVPDNRTGEFVQAMHDCTGGRAVVDVVPAGSVEKEQPAAVDVPVLMETPRFLRPFRALTEGFGVPAYHMVDPTLFVAVTFLLMFGMMFGDVGHGLVLMGGGALLAARAPALSDIGKLAIYCGVSSAIFGALYGSVFGMEGLFPALWMHPLEHVGTLFATTIGFGVVFISIGLLLNIANAVRRGELAREFFDASGPLVVVAYWAGVGLVARTLSSSPAAPNAPLAALVAVPLGLLFAKGPILRLLGRQAQAFPEGIGVYIMESAVEIMEVLMGFVANTVSFIRVAAFGLAHAALFLAVFGIAGSISQSALGGVLSVLVIILGNIVIILLEGLVVVIQALRLEYYEFFGKFFKETGTKFDPVGFS